MRPSLRFRLDRLARSLVRERDPFDGDAPTWDWPDPLLDHVVAPDAREVAAIVRRYNEAWARFVAGKTVASDLVIE